MRIRLVVAFVLGFAVGVLCLAAGLWRFGALRIATQRVTVGVTTTTEPPPSAPQPPPPTVPLDLNGMVAQAKNMPGPPAVSPPDLAQPAAPAQGGADRLATDIAGPHLAMPIAGVDPKKLSDNFQEPRDGRKHEALDIMAPRGTPILAVDEGNVAKLFTSKQGGLAVYQFDNTGKWCYYYAHLDRYAPGLKEGTLLRKGEVLGYVGTTGDAPPNAPHLHLSVFKLGPEKKWWAGTAVDPLPLLQ